MQTQNTPFPLQRIIDEFGFEGEYTGYRISNDGHINNTFVVDFKNADGSDVSYLVQLINTNVFKNPDELMENIVKIRDTFGIAIMLIEHDMNLVMGVCEGIAVVNYGKIIAKGTPDQIRSNPEVIEAYLGKKGAADAESR